MAKTKVKETIEELAKNLCALIGINASVMVNEKDDSSYEVDLETDSEAGLLIGFRGENINAIQTVLGMMVKSVNNEWIRIVVNVGDYRQKEEQKLVDLADQAAQRALETKTEQPLYNLTATQRRVVHMHLSMRKDITTESEGVEQERYLVVKPK